MAEIIISQENPLTLLDVKRRIEVVKKRDKELGFRGKKINEYLEIFGKEDEKKQAEMKKKIEELNISRLKEKHIIKILDIMPENMDGLKSVFVGEPVTIKPEDLQRILECLK